jgi:hypothetical protein
VINNNNNNNLIQDSMAGTKVPLQLVSYAEACEMRQIEDEAATSQINI